MQEKQIRDIITQDYGFNKWKPVLDFVFPEIKYERNILPIEDNSGKTVYIHQKGSFKLTDGKNIIILEAKVKSDFRIAKSRVGFHELTRKFIDQANNHGILIFYFSEDTEQIDYRLSFICRESRFTEDGELEEFKTHPKRYTYILGANESGQTAAKRLRELAEKNNNTFTFELKDVIDAFSVEKLNNEFFKKYKEQYEVFNRFLIEDEKIRHSIFDIPKNEKQDEKEKNELPIRDFTKKLLGRLVFLHFLQKKGWLGVPAPAKGQNIVWKNGKQNFLYQLFIDCKKQSKFHSKYLSELFFNTLNNNKRKDFLFLIDDETPFADGKKVSVPYLNGGLFDDDFSKGRQIDFPVDFFTNLFEFFNAYNFTIDENSPEDHDVGIDPEMLGHIFENLLEDNRDKGAYYTPKEVVHYMSQQSLIEYLKSKLNSNNEDITTFIIENKITPYIEQNAETIKQLLSDIKVCDPAIGSGAFPMGILKEIFEGLQKIHDFQNQGVPFDGAKAKKHIIQHSIYGVDLEKGAVDIARLRFWLALVVDEDEPQPLPNLDYKIMQGNSVLESFEDVDLSNLLKEDNTDDIITAHNGQVELVGFGKDQSVFVFDKTDKKEFQELLDLYFDFKESKKHKYTSKKEVKDRINTIIEGKLKAKFALDKTKYQAQLAEKEKHIQANAIKSGEPKGYQEKKRKAIEKLSKEIEALQYKIAHLAEILEHLNEWEHSEKDRPYFLWHTYFKNVFDNGGFDIVIGNPPYIKEYTNRSAFNGLHTSDYYQGKMDIWYFFASFCLDLLNYNGGIECFIAQNNWITSAGASKFRKKVLNETEIVSFVDFGNYKVFQSAGIQTMIYVLRKTTPRQCYTVKHSRLLVDNMDKEFLHSFLSTSNVESENFIKSSIQIEPQKLVGGYISFNSSESDLILNKIINAGTERIFESELAQGIVPNPDVVNTRNIKKFTDKVIEQKNIKVGDGVFVVSKGTFDGLDATEKKYIKPIFEPSEVEKYKFVNDYDKEILYITKKNYQDDAPNLIQHLEKYRAIMDERRENQNGRIDFYHLHWARDDKFFKEGPKILSVRKCAKPTFIYTEEQAYVMMAFNIIKSDRFNLKYLTAILNSKLVAYWLKNKGKLQGNIFQIDTEPLIEIPIAGSAHENVLATLVDYILLVHKASNPQIIKYIDNELVINAIDEVINHCVYEIYFEQDLDQLDLKILSHLQNIRPLNGTDEDEKKVIEFYHWINEQKNPIRNTLLKANIVSKDLLAVINATIV